jgi:hypothetical protein
MPAFLSIPSAPSYSILRRAKAWGCDPHVMVYESGQGILEIMRERQVLDELRDHAEARQPLAGVMR